MRPPSFIAPDEVQDDENRVPREPVKKRYLLLYVDVNITPSKKGRVGIYDGDDL